MTPSDNSDNVLPAPASSQSVGRPIDAAMAVNHPAKEAIRELWIKQVNDFHTIHTDNDVPLYLTLCGKFALDIKMLVDRGIVKLTESGAIATESRNRVIAVERASLAVLEISRLYPGLKILDKDFDFLIKGKSLIDYRGRENKEDYDKICCARIINLDFDTSLDAENAEEGIIFPAFKWVQKVSQIHADKKPSESWCLCLTFNGSINWTQTASDSVRDFLLENYSMSPEFEASCRSLFGANLQNKIVDTGVPVDFSSLSNEDKQKLLMVFVPKKIARLVHGQGWLVKTTWNLHYSGGGGAPMVTWILSYEWDTQASSTPNAVYKKSLLEIFASPGRVEDNGQIQTWTLK